MSGGTRIVVESLRFNWQTGPGKDPRLCALNIRYDRDKLTRLPEWQATAVVTGQPTPLESAQPDTAQPPPSATAASSQPFEVAKLPADIGADAAGPGGEVHSGASPVVYSFEDVIQGSGPQVEARFALEDGRSGWLWVFATGGELLGPVLPKLVWFAKGRSGPVELQLTAHLIGKAGGGLGVARVLDARWEWFAVASDRLATTAGKPPSLETALAAAMPLYYGAAATGWASFVTHHDVFVVRRMPKAPWVQQPYAASNRYLPWARVLEYACDMPEKVPAGMVAAETVKGMTDLDEILALHLCVGLWPKPGREALLGVAYNYVTEPLMSGAGLPSLNHPAMKLSALFEGVDQLALNFESTYWIDPKRPATFAGQAISCGCVSFAYVLETFGAAVGLPLRSVVLTAEPVPGGVFPGGGLPEFSVWPYVPYGIPGWQSQNKNEEPYVDVSVFIHRVPPKDFNPMTFQSHVFCIGSPEVGPQGARLPPTTRVFDITMWVNRNLASAADPGLPSITKWTPGDTYGLPYAVTSTNNYVARRLVNAAQELYAYLLDPPTLE